MYLKNAALSKPLPVLRTASFGRKDGGLLPGSGGLEETQLSCDSTACFLGSLGLAKGRRRPCSAFHVSHRAWYIVSAQHPCLLNWLRYVSPGASSPGRMFPECAQEHQAACSSWTGWFWGCAGRGAAWLVLQRQEEPTWGCPGKGVCASSPSAPRLCWARAFLGFHVSAKESHISFSFCKWALKIESALVKVKNLSTYLCCCCLVAKSWPNLLPPHGL